MDKLIIEGEDLGKPEGIICEIIADSFNKEISIKGWLFNESSLQELQNWIDKFLQESDDIILLRYLPIPASPQSTSMRCLEYRYFPTCTDNWEDYLGYFEIPSKSPLRDVLSSFKTFNFIIENDGHAHGKMSGNILKKEVELSGRFISECTHAYLFPLYSWISTFINKEDGKTFKMIFKLEYFNTPASKEFTEIFELVKRLGVLFQIDWYYHQDDEDMKQAGVEFGEFCGISKSITLIRFE